MSYEQSSRVWAAGRGATLIEALAGLAILGTLLVAVLMARGRYAQQWALGRERIEAAAVAEEILTQWWSGDLSKLPRGESGEVPGRPGWLWRTSVRPLDKDWEGFSVDRMRLEITRGDGLRPAGDGSPAGMDSRVALATVEFLAPTPTPATENPDP